MNTTQSFISVLPFVGVTLILVLLFHVVYCVLTPFNDMEEIRSGNLAAGFNRGGATFGIVIATLGSLIMSTEPTYLGDLGMFAVDGLFAVVVFLLIMYSIDLFVLVKIKNWIEIQRDNRPVGFVEGCIYAGQGVIMCGAFSGSGSGFWMGMLSAAVFSVLGQITLALMYWIYVLLHWKQGVENQLAQRDWVTALAVGTTMIAGSITLAFSIAGDYTGFGSDVWSFSKAAVASIVFVTVIRELCEFASRKLGYGHTVASAAVIGPLVIGMSAVYSVSMV